MASKIEQALERIVTQPDGTRSIPGTMESRARGSASIARMRESQPRTPQALTAMRIIHPAVSPRVTNAFRQLRTSLLRRAGNRNFLLLVTGASEDAGASFVARNLAAAFALEETKTSLLVDCNIADPQASDLFADGNEALPGLTDYLDGHEPRVGRIVHETGVPRMRILPVGRSRVGGAEYFTGSRLRTLFQEILGRYPDRYVIVDAPPILTTADTRILADICHSVMLVVPYAGVTVSQVEAAVGGLPPDRFVGTVVNNDPPMPFSA
jgi:Mrp family chromosome partitioning ATPase